MCRAIDWQPVQGASQFSYQKLSDMSSSWDGWTLNTIKRGQLTEIETVGIKTLCNAGQNGAFARLNDKIMKPFQKKSGKSILKHCVT